MMNNGFGNFGFGNNDKVSEQRNNQAKDSNVDNDRKKDNDVLLDDEDIELDKDFFIDKSNRANEQPTEQSEEQSDEQSKKEQSDEQSKKEQPDEQSEEQPDEQPEDETKPELTQVVDNQSSDDYLPSYEVGVLFTSKKDFDNFFNEFNENYHKMSQYFYQLGDGQIGENLSIRDRNTLIKKISEIQTEMYMSYNRFNDEILANINDLRRFLVSTNVDFNSFDRFLNDDEIRTERLNVDEVSFYDDTLR